MKINENEIYHRSGDGSLIYEYIFLKYWRGERYKKI